MNPIQEAIARATGLDQEIAARESQIATVNETLESKLEVWETEKLELFETLEHIDSQNALLQRQIEDIDYLNLFDIGGVMEVIPMANRKNTINRLRRLRQENPLAKQAIKLILRFTLGKGVELVVGPDPEDQVPLDPLVIDGEAPPQNGNGKAPKDLFPNPNAKRPRPQISEAEQIDTAADPSGKSDELKEIVDSFWMDDDNMRALTDRPAMYEWLDGVATDGEKFMIGFISPSAPYIKLTEIPMEEVDTIIYDPDNWKKPVYYVRQYRELVWDGQARVYKDKDNNQPKTKYYLDYRITDEELPDLKTRIKVPTAELAPDDQRIKHSMVNPLWTKKGKRGVSELYSSREWFRVYKEFMEDRAAINAAATAVAYKRKIKGGPAAVASMANKFGGLNVGQESHEIASEIGKLARPSPASVHDSNSAVDLEWMKADTGAVNAKEDGRSILTAAGAGTGMFVHYFGDGGDANLATAQAMELPMVKTFEDWQQWLEDELKEFIKWLIRVATDQENAKKQIARIAGSFPPIISQDVVKFMTAWSQLAQNVAPGNRIVHREAIKGGLTVMSVPNIDSLMNEIDAEEKQLEAQRQAQQAAMIDAMKNGGLGGDETNSNGNGKGARDGSSNAIDPGLKTIVKGKPAIARNGGKPPR